MSSIIAVTVFFGEVVSFAMQNTAARSERDEKGHSARHRWEERTRQQSNRWNEPAYHMAQGIFSAEERLVGLMFRAGVPIMAGTDAMNPYCFPGFSLHDELALLVESGLSPLAALQTATINPARFLVRTADIGTIEVGKTANLVLLRSDPLADIHNSAQVEGVWLQGKYFSKSAIDEMLATAQHKASHD